MNRTERAIHEVNQLNTLALRNQWVNQIHPLVKFVLTISYITMTVSFHKYDVMGVLGMLVYPLALFTLADLSFKECLYRLRIVIPLVFLMGAFNPLFDPNRVVVGGVEMSAGVLSMITLLLKGSFCVFASYILIATTTIEGICYGLRRLHMPKVMVNQLLLTYRYIALFLAEVNRTTQAYALRAPRQKGIHFKAWGSLVGQMLLRSIDRANEVYESMMLRGFQGEFYVSSRVGNRMGKDIAFLLCWIGIMLVFRLFPILLIVGNLIRGMG